MIFKNCNLHGVITKYTTYEADVVGWGCYY